MSYYEMKNRAGVVGKNGLGPLLAGLGRPAADPSDGPQLRRPAGLLRAGRAARSAHRAASPIKSLTLIQGAFSHFTFASPLPFDGGRGGALAGHGARVDGPLLATFTAADRPSGGGIRRPASLPARTTRPPPTSPTAGVPWATTDTSRSPHRPPSRWPRRAQPYDFAPGQFYALDANAVINANQSAFSGAHSDIRHPEVLWAVASAANLAG